MDNVTLYQVTIKPQIASELWDPNIMIKPKI